MSKLDDYKDKYKNIRFERRDGILQVTFHTEGKSLKWGFEAHSELPDAFEDIGGDRENKVVILTGTGDEFSGPRVVPGVKNPLFAKVPSIEFHDNLVREAKKLLMNLLDIDAVMISAINGPAWRHSEMPLLSDIVLASETAIFQDSGHFPGGLVPGDGMHIVYPLLMGQNRGRYFLLTGQQISAREAKDMGLVAEVLPQDKVLARAWELAEQIAKAPATLIKNTRIILTEHLKRQMRELLGLGLYIETYVQREGAATTG
jgi:enoyl-CoA hydratase/carnithine racemase